MSKWSLCIMKWNTAGYISLPAVVMSRNLYRPCTQEVQAMHPNLHKTLLRKTTHQEHIQCLQKVDYQQETMFLDAFIVHEQGLHPNYTLDLKEQRRELFSWAFILCCVDGWAHDSQMPVTQPVQAGLQEGVRIAQWVSSAQPPAHSSWSLFWESGNVPNPACTARTS